MKKAASPHILLIDDDPLFGGVLHRRAEAKGLRLEFHESLVETLYESYLESYDAAIIDCCMPGLDGFEIAKYLSTFFEHVPIVLVSQADGPFQRYLEDQGGAVAFVSKRQGAEAILTAAERLARATAV